MIDQLSQNIITLALYLNKIKPGSVSEVWIDKMDLRKTDKRIEQKINVDNLVSSTFEQIESLQDSDRKTYLQEILSSLQFQFLNNNSSLGEYYEQAYGFKIDRVSDKDLENIESQIYELEQQVGKDRFQVIKEHTIKKSQLIHEYKQILSQTKQKVPPFLTDIKNSHFSFEIVTKKPWVAFNSHLAAFTSKLSLNSDSELTDLDLIKFSQHEAWGGHHSELSLKDILLVEKGRGEHGIVIVNSPQVFVSEGIAEGLFHAFGLFDQLTNEQQLLWWYTRKLIALHNLAAHYYFDDKKTKEEISNLLHKYNVGNTGVKIVVDFSTDESFGRYSAVYYSASTLISDLYRQSNQKTALLEHLFTQPCTPNLLVKKFSVLT